MPFNLRNYAQGDLEGFTPNAHSDQGVYRRLFDLDSVEVKTLVRDKKIKAFFAYMEYAPNLYNAAFVIAEGFSGADALCLKKALDSLIVDEEVERIETESIASPEQDRWHEFLGLRLCGKKTKFLYGKDFHIWEWLKDGG